MSLSGESMAERKRRLAADIARQRGELAAAYQGLTKPLHYAESGLRGLSFLRQNPWIFTAVPATLSTTTLVVGLLRELLAWRSGSPRRLTKGGRRLEADVERDAKRSKKSLLQHAGKWGKRGFAAFRIYQRARKFFLP